MAYCTQTDLENRIGAKILAQLTNDTVNATTADTTVVNALILKAQTKIDGLAGQVYTVPFDPVPQEIIDLSVDFACYFAFQRRSENIEMPKSWQDTYNKAEKTLIEISDLSHKLPTANTITSNEADLVTVNDKIFDFSDTSLPISGF